MLICVLRFCVNLLGDCKISSVRNCIPQTFQVVEGVLVEVKIVSWGFAKTKGNAHKHELTKNIFCTVMFWHH